VNDSIKVWTFCRPQEESPSKRGYHWNSNAETYFLIGEALSLAMLRFLHQDPQRRTS
jgi:alpha-galactosidase